MTTGNFGIPRVMRKAAIQDRIDRISILKHPGFRWDFDQAAFEHYTFGCRLTGVGSNDYQSVEPLTHELAHAVEFGPDVFDRRSEGGSFRFDIPKTELPAQFWNQYNMGVVVDPQTSAMTERECATVGIQFHLLAMMGYRISKTAYVNHFANVFLDFMPDSYMCRKQQKDWIESAICGYSDRKWIVDRLGVGSTRPLSL